MSGVSRMAKNSADLTGCLVDIMVHANGPSTPGLRCPLAVTRSPMLPSGMHTPWAGSDSYKDFGAQYHSQPDGHARSVHPRVLSVYASTLDFGGVSGYHPLGRPYTIAATLDTEPLARSYSGGVHTRLSSNHFQFARASDCYVILNALLLSVKVGPSPWVVGQPNLSISSLGIVGAFRVKEPESAATCNREKEVRV